MLGCCLSPYQRLRLYNAAPFSRLLRHAGDMEERILDLNPRRPHGGYREWKPFHSWTAWKFPQTNEAVFPNKPSVVKRMAEEVYYYILHKIYKQLITKQPEHPVNEATDCPRNVKQIANIWAAKTTRLRISRDTIMNLHEMTYARLGYCFTPYRKLWLYNGAPLVAFYGTLGIRRT